MEAKTDRIRELNDQLRQNFADGVAVMTPGIAALGPQAVERIVKTIAVFDDFCHANDPHQEHDFGASSPASGPSGSLQTLSILWRRFDAVSRQAARLHRTRRQVVRQLGAEHLKNLSGQSGKKRGEPVSLLSKDHPRSPAVSAGGFSVVVSAHWTATGPWRF